MVTNGVSARNDADNIGYDARVVLGSNIMITVYTPSVSSLMG